MTGFSTSVGVPRLCGVSGSSVVGSPLVLRLGLLVTVGVGIEPVDGIGIGADGGVGLVPRGTGLFVDEPVPFDWEGE